MPIKAEDITMKNIYFYHGKLDGSVPLSMVKLFSKKIEGATFKVFEDEGHLSIFFNSLENILDDLKRAKRSL